MTEKERIKKQIEHLSMVLVRTTWPPEVAAIKARIAPLMAKWEALGGNEDES